MKRIIILLIEVVLNVYLLMGIDVMKTCNRIGTKAFDNSLYENLGVDNNYMRKYLNYYEKEGIVNHLLIKGDEDCSIVNIFIEEFMKHKGTGLEEVIDSYEGVKKEMIYFPVAEYENDTEKVMFENGWNGHRTYGGERLHKGTDIMTSNNVAGYFPVISVCDGVVDKMGWLELGGYRVGILSDNGIYYYYAHLDSYAHDIKVGEKVVAGQLLGFVGDTGYGKEGTKGKFDVHLHFGIYLLYDNEEYPINPYEFLMNENLRRIRYEK